MRPEPRTRRISGFAVAWMLVLVAIIALASGAALHDVLFAQQLATIRAQQQRTLGMAELGLRIGMQQLSRSDSASPDSGELRPGPHPADSLQVVLHRGAARVPAGFSAGRFVAREYEIESTGRSARNSRQVLVQGISRLEPLAPSAP
jgi:hypothetical protein